MTKDQLVKEIAKKRGIDKSQVETIVESFLRTVQEKIMQREPVTLRRFGSFLLKERAAKKARNIGKNTEMLLPAHFIPKFKPSKEFSKKIKQIKTGL